MNLYIPVILGTAREGRQAEKVANFVLGEVKHFGLETELIDVRDFHNGATGKEPFHIHELAKKISLADGYIVVTPEYNHGYPGELKMMLDLFYEEYNRKPIGFCGVSAGILGGARVVEQLRLVSIEFRMVPIREAVYFGNVQKLFDGKGEIQDPSYRDRMKKFLEELVWYANTLQKARGEHGSAL